MDGCGEFRLYFHQPEIGTSMSSDAIICLSVYGGGWIVVFIIFMFLAPKEANWSVGKKIGLSALAATVWPIFAMMMLAGGG